MNICLITARIIEMPRRFLSKNKYATSFVISFPHKRKQLCYATVIVRGKMSEDTVDLYFKGDYVIIEGKLLISKTLNKKQNCIVNILNIHPAHIIMQK